MNYNLNIAKLIDRMLPAFLRTERQKEWLAMLTRPLKTISQDFSSLRTTTENTLKYNGQTISLERMMSQQFGPGINIKNKGKVVRPFYIHASGDGRNPQVAMAGDLRNPRIYEAGQFDPDSVDFEIEVPEDMPIDLDRLVALVNQYKTYSKRFKIMEI